MPEILCVSDEACLHTWTVSHCITVCTQSTLTPLLIAALKGHAKITVALIQAKANVNAKDDVRVRGGMPAYLDCLSVSLCVRSIHGRR